MAKQQLKALPKEVHTVAKARARQAVKKVIEAYLKEMEPELKEVDIEVICPIDVKFGKVTVIAKTKQQSDELPESN